MKNLNANRDNCLFALTQTHDDPKAYKLVESLINNYFEMLEHMKETTLYDIYMYEERLTQPLEILAYDNEKLKKEINKLRQKFGLGRKYKEALEDIRDNLLVTAGARAAYMHDANIIDIPSGLKGEDELAQFISHVVDEYLAGDYGNFDIWIEQALKKAYELKGE